MSQSEAPVITLKPYMYTCVCVGVCTHVEARGGHHVSYCVNIILTSLKQESLLSLDYDV